MPQAWSSDPLGGRASARRREPLRLHRERLRQLRWPHHLHRHLEPSERCGEGTPRPRTGFEGAALVVHSRDGAVAREGQHVAGRRVQQHRPPAGPLIRVRPLEPRRDERVDITAWHDPRHERSSRRHSRPHSMRREEPPVLPVEVPREQVPPALRCDEMVRLDPPDRPRLGVVPLARQVVEADRHPVTQRLPQHQQHIEGHRDGRRITGTPDRGHLDGIEPVPNPRWQHLTHGPERTHCRLPDTGAQRRSRPQRDRDRKRLVVVEEQRGHVVSRLEAVSAVGTHRCLDAVAHLAKTVDVTPHRAMADTQPRRQHRPRPIAPGLQQRQQSEQSRRRSHVVHVRANRGQKQTYTAETVDSQADPGRDIEEQTCPCRPPPI